MAGLKLSARVASGIGIAVGLVALNPHEPAPASVLSGRRAMGDWTTDAPGVRRKITVADLPPPYATASAENDARIDGGERVWRVSYKP